MGRVVDSRRRRLGHARQSRPELEPPGVIMLVCARESVRACVRTSMLVGVCVAVSVCVLEGFCAVANFYRPDRADVTMPGPPGAGRRALVLSTFTIARGPGRVGPVPGEGL